MLAEAADDIVALYEPTGKLLYVSPSSGRITGWLPEDVLGQRRDDVVHPEDTAIAAEARQTLARHGHATFEWRCRRKDGSYVWLETRNKLIVENGVPTHVLSVSRDIEKRREAEQALRRSLDRFSSLVQHAAYGIYVSSVDGRFLDVNRALVNMLGYDSEDELLALDLSRDLYQNPAERAELTRRAEVSDKASEWVEVHWKRKEGTPITVQLSVNSVRDAQGQVIYFEGIAEDVTERRRREEAARRSERMASLGTMLAGVAHELNNPLAAISGFAQIMLRSDRNDEDRSALDTIQHEAGRAAKIVKDLLIFARRQNSEPREYVDMNSIVTYIASTRRYALETRGTRLTLDLSPSLPRVIGDRSELEQVILNLLVNAEQALAHMTDAPADLQAGSRSMLSLSTGVYHNSVVVEIADSGPGIPAADLAQIWDPFWTTKAEGEGTGLGLAVVHGIVAGHGGSIDVRSEPGHGTTFTIRLPAAAAQNEVRTAERETQAASRPLDILVVDDEPAIVQFVESYLISRGHAVVVAHDGPTALQLAQQSGFDLVICDLRMPHMDGAEVIERLRAMPHMKGTRYIVCTGDASSLSARLKIDEIKPAAVLTKPYRIEELRKAIEV
jgi:PAS domain S-box-containing protein